MPDRFTEMTEEVAQLRSDLEEAEAAKQALVDERRKKRASMSKANFRAFNEETKQAQLDAQAAVDAAQKALNDALGGFKQEILVGTLSETNSAGGTS